MKKRIYLALMSASVPAVGTMAPPANAREKLGEGVTLVQVELNDPANPAILDTKGKYARQLLYSAEKIWAGGDQGRAWFSAKLKPKLYKKEKVCEQASADIYETEQGKLIVKFLKFYDAQQANSGPLSCAVVGRADDVIAPTPDHYLAARWAVDALKDPLRQAFGTKNDPFCQPRIIQRCPTREEFESYLKTAEAFSAKSCSIYPSDCIGTEVMFFVRENGELKRIIKVDFQVEYVKDKVGARQLKSYSFKLNPPPVPAPPGAPRIRQSGAVHP